MEHADSSPFTPAQVIARLVADDIDPQDAFGHFHADGGPEVERNDELAPPWFTDCHAVLLHRVLCGCLWPENQPRATFYGGRTQMPFATFSATAGDLA